MVAGIDGDDYGIRGQRFDWPGLGPLGVPTTPAQAADCRLPLQFQAAFNGVTCFP